MTQYGAIPTVYKGIRFRSRLEATWAAFFQEVGWPWSYEPVDLSGYIPDFVLGFEAGPVLVEVKPAFRLEDLAPYQAKIIDAGWRDEALVVGVGPFLHPDWNHPVIGSLFDLSPPSILAEPTDDPHARGAWGAGLLGLCGVHMGIGLSHGERAYHCRVCGAYPGRANLMVPDGQVERAWGAARNAVQWSPRG